MSSSSDYGAIIERAFLQSWEQVNQTEGWKVLKPASLLFDCVDKVEWRHSSACEGANQRKMFRVTATLKSSVEKVAHILKDVNRASSWNQTLQVSIYSYPAASRLNRYSNIALN